eukprot:g2964.t1
MPHASTGRCVLPSRGSGTFEAYKKRSEDAVRLVLQGRMQRLFESRERGDASNSLTAVQLNLQTPQSPDQGAHRRVTASSKNVGTQHFLPDVNMEQSSVRTHACSSLTPSAEGAHQTLIEVSPRISPWGNTDLASHNQNRADISVEQEQSNLQSEEHGHHKVTSALGFSPANQAHDSNYVSQSNITVVVERKRHFSPVTYKMVDLFASGSSNVVADNRTKRLRKSTPIDNEYDAPADREDPSFSEYLYRKEGLPELNPEDQTFYRRELLESRNAAERIYLSDLFRNRVLAVDNANTLLERICKTLGEDEKRPTS